MVLPSGEVLHSMAPTSRPTGVAPTTPRFRTESLLSGYKDHFSSRQREAMESGESTWPIEKTIASRPRKAGLPAKPGLGSIGFLPPLAASLDRSPLSSTTSEFPSGDQRGEAFPRLFHRHK